MGASLISIVLGFTVYQWHISKCIKESGSTCLAKQPYVRIRDTLDDLAKIIVLFGGVSALVTYAFNTSDRKKYRSLEIIFHFIDEYIHFRELIPTNSYLNGTLEEFVKSKPAEENEVKKAVNHMLRHCETFSIAVRHGLIDDIVARDIMMGLFNDFHCFTYEYIKEKAKRDPGLYCEFRNLAYIWSAENVRLGESSEEGVDRNRREMIKHFVEYSPSHWMPSIIKQHSEPCNSYSIEILHADVRLPGIDMIARLNDSKANIQPHSTISMGDDSKEVHVIISAIREDLKPDRVYWLLKCKS